MTADAATTDAMSNGAAATESAALDSALLERAAALGPHARAAVEEVLDAIGDVADRCPDPSLRQVLQQVFVRSVNEFFTGRAQSMRLPRELMAGYRASTDIAAVVLPEIEPRTATLDEVFAQRRSVRSFAKEPMPLETLATVLGAAVGKVGEEDGYGVRALPLFPYPSTGGLSSFEIGVVAQRVEGVRPGYYVLDQVGSRLVPRIAGDLRLGMQDVTFESEWLLYAPVVLVLAHRAARYEWKYHTRGYRFSHIDLGAAMQNVYLSAWASEIGACAVAGYLDEAANDLLGYDGVDEYVSLLMAIGAPAHPIVGAAPR